MLQNLLSSATFNEIRLKKTGLSTKEKHVMKPGKHLLFPFFLFFLFFLTAPRQRGLSRKVVSGKGLKQRSEFFAMDKKVPAFFMQKSCLLFFQADYYVKNLRSLHKQGRDLFVHSLFCFRPFPETTFLERPRCRGAVLSSKKKLISTEGSKRQELHGLPATLRSGRVMSTSGSRYIH